MKVFISWSGNRSRAVAEALHWWFPKVLQGVRPFVSAKDIDKGANWTVELTRELEETEFGVVCLTPENLTSPWLHYETGAITKSVESRVCPLLHGLNKADVSAPMNQLQLTDLADQQDMLLLMTSMNAVAGNRLTTEDLRESVEMWWPRLTQRLTIVPAPASPVPAAAAIEPSQPKSSDRELLLEVLDAVRHLERRPPAAATTSQVDEASEARRVLRRALREAGLPVHRMLTGSARWVIYVEDLPEVIPTEAYTALADAARSQGTPIRLRAMSSGGRTVNFDTNGWSDEPPF